MALCKNSVKILSAQIFSKILYKTKFCNSNKGNNKLLSIDILKKEIQKDLFLITAHRIENTYSKLLEKGIPHEYMRKHGKLLFLQCIRKVCEDFLTKQYGYKVKVNLKTLQKSLYTKNLLKESELVFQLPFLYNF